MSEVTQQTAWNEWRRYGALPIAAAIGYSAVGLQTYGIGPFVAPLEEEFGWSRAQIMFGLTISNAFGVLFNFAVGVLVDRFGPRRVGLTGLVFKTSAFAMLATASGAFLNWSLLWVLVALGAMLTHATVWNAAVATRFDKGRGLAFAVALSGSSFTAAILPVLATSLIGAYGWRMAFAGTGIAWLLLTFPIVFFLFRGRHDERATQRSGELKAAAASLPGATLKEGLRMPAFWRLIIASFAFAFYTLALSPNLIPLLMEKGATAIAAAQIASLVGVLGIIARISAGFLLDRLPANVIGTVVFLLPVAGCGLLLADTPSYVVLALAVASFGITIGAEYDVNFYLVARHFGLRSFGGLMGAMLTAGALGGTIAPVAAGWIHDRYGNYDALLILLMGLMFAAAVAIATLGRPPEEYSTAAH